MREIDRGTAIKILWVEARNRGLSDTELHDIMEDNKLGRRISFMDGVQLHTALKVFGKELFVKEPGEVVEMRRLARATGINVEAFILKRFGKESVYKLSAKEKRSVLGMLRHYVPVRSEK